MVELIEVRNKRGTGGDEMTGKYKNKNYSSSLIDISIYFLKLRHEEIQI